MAVLIISPDFPLNFFCFVFKILSYPLRYSNNANIQKQFVLDTIESNKLEKYKDKYNFIEESQLEIENRKDEIEK